MSTMDEDYAKSQQRIQAAQERLRDPDLSEADRKKNEYIVEHEMWVWN